MTFSLNADTLIAVAAVVTALITIVKLIRSINKWYDKQEQQGTDISRLKEENSILVTGIYACLDGLEQLGANHTVPKAKQMLTQYETKLAHDQNSDVNKGS